MQRYFYLKRLAQWVALLTCPEDAALESALPPEGWLHDNVVDGEKDEGKKNDQEAEEVHYYAPH